MANDKTFDELTTQNTALFNLLFWHQVFLEGVRMSVARSFDVVLRGLYKEFQTYLSRVRYQNLNEFNKGELNEFIRRFQLVQTKFYSRYTDDLIKVLQKFVQADKDSVLLIMSSVTGQSLDAANADREHKTLKGVAGLDSLWASIATDPIPANGMTVQQMVNSFTNTCTNKMTQFIRMGYANGWTKDELLHNIFGSPSNNWRDGYFAKMYQQNGTMVGTAVSHTSAITQAAVASVFIATYLWVSIIDGHTTEICFGRNGKIYIVGQGPLAPAHWGCRAHTVAQYSDGDSPEIPATFADWLSEQPTDLVDTMLGSGLASSVRAKSKRNVTLASVTSPLTSEQFTAKIKQLVGAYKWR